MPEGPSIVILKEAVQSFKGKKILSVSGNSYQIDKEKLINQKVTNFKSWGKHFLICLPHYTIRIHFMLWGSYSINEQTKKNPRLHLHFTNGDLYLYSCSIKVIDDEPDKIYDWSGNVLNDAWSESKAFVLRKHWLVHTKQICPRCVIPLIKQYLGKTGRRTFYCENCQLLYGAIKMPKTQSFEIETGFFLPI